MKAQREHRVPLSDAAFDLLRGLYTERGNNFLFIGPKPGAGLSNAAMAAVLDRMGRDDITVHGFRSTFRDWAGETTAFPSDVMRNGAGASASAMRSRRHIGAATCSTSAPS